MNARSSSPRTSRAQSEFAASAGCRPAASSGRSSSATSPGSICLDRLHHALADAARRHVDHPPQADVVVRVDDEPHVGERVLDFLALVEPHAADDLVGEPFAHQRVFDRARLRVGAVEHGDRRVDVVGQARAGRARDEVGLLELVAAAEVDDPRAALAVGPEVLVLAVAVLADDGRRGVEDDLRRAVVAFELDDRRFGKVLLEVEDVPQVGAAPLVDRLIGIADDAQVAVDFGQPPDQQVLRPVRVLVFVDHDEAELLGVLRANALRLSRTGRRSCSSRSSKSSALLSFSAFR